MTWRPYAWLVCQAWLALALYDLLHWTRGFNGILQHLERHQVAPTLGSRSPELVCDAVMTATCLYWRPVLCLQRSFCAARLLRSHGIAARLIIGYRPVPFLSHAWVEVEGRVVNDSPVYRQRLHILHTV